MKTPMLSNLVGVLGSEIGGMSDKDLEKLIAESDRVTNTNCGWQEYAIADVAGTFAKNTQDDRLTGRNEF